MSCQLAHIEVDGLPAVQLENGLIRIGLLPGRGSDIYEFYHKPTQTDFLLRLNKGIRNPVTNFSQIRDTNRQFEDYYYGGWQVCLPNSPAFNYRGAELGQHGEVSLIPWSLQIIENTKERITVECSASVLRLPIHVTRRFTITDGAQSLKIEEAVTNQGKTSLDIMWGQHIAFGLPFLEEGITVNTNAQTITAEPAIEAPFLLERNKEFEWPMAQSFEGKTIDVSQVESANGGKYSELAYLKGYSKEAYYEIANSQVGFRLDWDGNLFNTLWMWQERNAIQDFPWWGDCYTVALEPWTSAWTENPEQAIANNEWLKLLPEKTIKTSIEARAFQVNSNP